MAKKFVKISLATKLRLLFGAAVLLIIAAALAVPWLFMEQLAEQGLQKAGDELNRLRLNEFVLGHPSGKDRDQVSALYRYHLGEAGQVEPRGGPTLIKLAPDMRPDKPLDSIARGQMKAFLGNPGQDVALRKSEDEQDHTVYRSFRAVRARRICLNETCHGPKADDVRLQFRLGQLVGMIDVTLPGSGASGALVWWTRVTFVTGGVLASLLALVLFWAISQRLILRPLRHLRDLADKVAEGDLAVRSTVSTGDELQRLGESFNEMLSAISDQHAKLRAANRALDLKLSELAEANVTLFKANKFLTNISHELRTPLNSIIGFADLVRECEDPRVQ